MNLSVSTTTSQHTEVTPQRSGTTRPEDQPWSLALDLSITESESGQPTTQAEEEVERNNRQMVNSHHEVEPDRNTTDATQEGPGHDMTAPDNTANQWPTTPQGEGEAALPGGTANNISDQDQPRGPAAPMIPVDEHQEEDEAQDNHMLTELQQILRGATTQEQWRAFETLLKQLTEECRKEAKIPERPQAANQQQQQRDPEDASFIQRLYRRNRRQAMRLILDGESERCKIDKGTIQEHFTDAWQDQGFDDGIYEPTADRTSVQTDPFTTREVATRLHRAENTAPGRDRLTYKHWRLIDPDCEVLTRVFNICRKFRRIPACWKDTVTILIHKKGGKELPKNWRPIALCDTMYKLYTGCWTSRISKWAAENDVISHAQKGFMPHDGVVEHNYILNAAMRKAKKGRSDLCVAWMDLTNAFGSIPHGAINRALECSGAGPMIVDIVKDLYNGGTTTILTADGMTDQIQIRSGIKQGCPLSGILFNIAINPVILALDDEQQECHRVLAFADDVALMSPSPEQLQEQINSAVELFGRLSIGLNIEKSATMHLSGKTPVGTRATGFHANGEPLRKLADGESVQFLGVPVGYNILSSRADLKTMMETGLKILRAKLAPWQRLDAAKTFFYPALNFAMRTGQFSKQQWEHLDNVIRPELKMTLSVPQEASNDYLYGLRAAGACGIPLAAEDSDLATIDAAYKLLTSRDPVVREEASRELHDTTTKRLKRPAIEEDIGNYLSGENTGEYQRGSNEARNTWTTARTASTRQQVSWSFRDNRPSLKKGETTIKPTRAKTVTKALREENQKERTRRLRSRRNQGKTLECIGASKASTHFLYSGENTRFSDWRFIHKARLNLVALSGAKPWVRQPEKRRCRRCNGDYETLPHVLQHCMRHSHAFQQRHDAVVARVMKASERKFQVLSENRAVAGTRLRPDLVLVRNQTAVIVDITIPFENGVNSLEAARERKHTKYAPLIPILLQTYTSVTIEAVVVGSLGSWDPANDRFIGRLCSRSYAKKMKMLCVSDVIRWSRDIYEEHLTGERQYEAARAARGEADVHRPEHQVQDT